MKRIAIVGAGPAGCHLARRLAGTDHEILLFDHRAPYEKPCGGGLSPLVGRRFPHVMALPFPRHMPPRMVIRDSDGSQIERGLDSGDWAIVSRIDLGQALLDRAVAGSGVRHIRDRVVGVERAEGGWSVRIASGEAFSVDFLVGADGVLSIVRERVIGPIPRKHLGLAVGYRVRGVPNAVVFQSYADMEGYLWSFPRVDYASVGIAARLRAMPPGDLWQRVEQFLDEVCPHAGRLDRYSALLPMAQDASLWDSPCAGPDWALLGDAAGHVHPITGEGIAYALWSADLLADALLQGAPDLYEHLWREHYGGALASAAETIRSTIALVGAFEMIFHLAMAAAMPCSGEAD